MKILNKLQNFFTREAPEFNTYIIEIEKLKGEIQEINASERNEEKMIQDISVVFNMLNPTHLDKLDTICNMMWSCLYYDQREEIFDIIVDGASSSTTPIVIQNLKRLYPEFNYKLNLLRILPKLDYDKYYDYCEPIHDEIKKDFDIDLHKELYTHGVSANFCGNTGSIIRSLVYAEYNIIIGLKEEIDPDYYIGEE